jgi:hypothetical protein
MGDTDPFVYLRCLPEKSCEGFSRPTRPGRPDTPWGVCPSSGGRVGVALSYLTPVAQWHTIWRTLANRGE